ncbi:30S ribosomal protein S6e [Candidatus Woesearchaeota archaeon]|nr:30S ribosomal protein S6e [Candidatus Woesearchaeota archaeon]
MVSFKLVISDPKTKRSHQKEVQDPEASYFLGKRLGEAVKGDHFGMAGYEMQIRGGSDSSGFPMRADVSGTGRKRVLAVEGVGMRKKGKGQKQRKTVCGNTVHEGISQINLKVTKEGKEKLGGAAEAPAEAPKEEKKPGPKKQEKPAEGKKEAPKEEKKEKPKQEKKPEPKKEEKPAEEKQG